MDKKIVPYRRVSTAKQGESGLGLMAQEAAIQAFVEANNCKVLKAYTENESGTHDDLADRPELLKAISHAKRSGATLLIAKLDRLVRSTIAMAAIKQSGVSFTACDMPTANEFTIDIHVAVAADEARKISLRTKEALKAYKADGRVSKRVKAFYKEQGMEVPQSVIDERGGKLGAALNGCKLTEAGRRKGIAKAAAKNKAKAISAYEDLLPTMRQWRDQGRTLQAIADLLNEEHTTRRGARWNKVQVRRVLERAEAQ